MSPRGALTLCRCGAVCTPTGARTCDCEPAPVERVRTDSTLARAAVVFALRGGDAPAMRDAAWLVRGGDA